MTQAAQLAPLVIIDTMIVLGAIIGKPNGSDARVLHLVETGVIRLASSDSWLRELANFLSRPEITKLILDPGRAFKVALTVGTTGAAYRPERFDWLTLTDIKDWWILDLVFESGADCIVTRDTKVLKAATKLGFEARTPPQFLGVLGL